MLRLDEAFILGPETKPLPGQGLFVLLVLREPFFVAKPEVDDLQAGKQAGKQKERPLDLTRFIQRFSKTREAGGLKLRKLRPGGRVSNLQSSPVISQTRRAAVHGKRIRPTCLLGGVSPFNATKTAHSYQNTHHVKSTPWKRRNRLYQAMTENSHRYQARGTINSTERKGTKASVTQMRCSRAIRRRAHTKQPE